MTTSIEVLLQGTVTSPRGFRAGATYAGIKKMSGETLDLGILFSETPCAAAAVFTRNLVKAAPVLLSQKRVSSGAAQALVVNSGCANAYTGKQGMADAEATTELAATSLGVPPEHVLVASTGVIGKKLPMKQLREGLRNIALSSDGGHELARAIMTTDRVPKEIAVSAGGFTIGGIAKGAGMIHPDLATMLSFVCTDARVSAGYLSVALRKAADVSFNMISVDGDNSTNDTLLVMANGESGVDIKPGAPQAQVFQDALDRVCTHLAKSIAADGEGATKLIEVTVIGAATEAEARACARTIVSSSLVKTAIHGNDPNWGRIVAAAGRSGARFDPARLNLSIGSTGVVRNGEVLPFDAGEVVATMKKKEVAVLLDLQAGSAIATAWGCDMSAEYVAINAEYMT